MRTDLLAACFDRMRLELARRYLLNEGLPISKVAWLLGYKEVGRVLARVPPLDRKIAQPGRARSGH